MLYQGREYAFVDMTLTGFPGDAALFRSGVRAIRHSEEVRFVEAKGADPVRLPSGSPYDYVAGLTMDVLLSRWIELINTLPDAYAEERFDLKTTLSGRKLTKVTFDAYEVQIRRPQYDLQREMADGVVIPVEFSVRLIKVNGKAMVRL